MQRYRPGIILKSLLVLLFLLAAGPGVSPLKASFYMSYLKIGFQGKDVALRMASANSMGVSAVYFNPANLGRQKGLDMSLNYANLYNQNIKYSALGGVGKYKEYGVGAGLIVLESEKMNVYDRNAQIKGTIKPLQMALILGGAKRVGDWSFMGASATIAYEHLWQEHKFGVGFNLSAIMELNEKNQLSFIVRNILGPRVKYSKVNTAPFTYGMSYSKQFGTRTNLYLAYLQPEGYKVGLERQMSSISTLYLGLDNYSYSGGFRVYVRKAYIDVSIVYTKHLSYYAYTGVGIKL